jgi:hypothetical protein
MCISRSTRVFALVAAGIAGVPAVGCSKESERSIAVAVDSSVPVQSPETNAVGPTTPRKPVGHPVRKSGVGVTRAVSTDTTPKAPKAAETAASAPATGQDEWLSYDAATNTVTFELIAGPFTFNGYRNGEATLVVPPKANIVMNFINKDGTPHSAIVISGEGPIPTPQAIRPFQGLTQARSRKAYRKKPVT